MSWEGGSASASSTSTSRYPPDLLLLIDLMDLNGRDLIQSLQKSSSESARTSSKDTYRPWAGYNKVVNDTVEGMKGKGRGKRKIESDDSENEGGSVSYDSDGRDAGESKQSIASDDDIDDVSVSDDASDGDENNYREADKAEEREKGRESKRRTKGQPIISKRSESDQKVIAPYLTIKSGAISHLHFYLIRSYSGLHLLQSRSSPPTLLRFMPPPNSAQLSLNSLTYLPFSRQHCDFNIANISAHHISSQHVLSLTTHIGQASISNAASSIPSNRSSSRRTRGVGRTRRASSGLRSRNSVIDRWLKDEDGSDTYADLEDFLVE